MTEFTIERTFAAPRPVIWRAWTDPVVASRWWHPAGFTTDPASVRIDLRPGGRYAYTMVGPDGSTHPTEGSYVAVRPPEHLQFTWSDPGDAPSDAPLVTVDLTDLAGQRTAMRFHMSRFGATPDMLTNVRGGWQEAFDILASVL